MSNSSSSLQSTREAFVPVLVNEQLRMISESSLDELKVLAYDRGCTVELVLQETIAEMEMDEVRHALSLLQARVEALRH